MDPLAVVLVLVAVALTVAVIAAPLRADRAEGDEAGHEAQLADLEAAKEARYREIREAEMDFRTGKLSEADWRAIDRQLRAEAVELLRRLDALGATERAATAGEPLPSDPPCSRPSSPSSRSRSASS
jgi:flagellar biosynthesis/type III secretory pathway M-ring protein FliF/YscJ